MSLSEFWLKSMRIVLLTGLNAHAQTFLMPRVVDHLVHGTCFD